MKTLLRRAVRACPTALFAAVVMAIGVALHWALPPEPRWCVREPFSVHSVRPEGVLLHAGENKAGPIVLRDLATGEIRHSFFQDGAGAGVFRMSEAGPWLAVWTDHAKRSEIWLIDLETGTQRAIPFAKGDTLEMQFSPSAPVFAWRSDDRLELCDARTGESLDRFRDTKGMLDDRQHGWAFAPGGEYFLLGFHESVLDFAPRGRIKIWDMARRRWVATLPDTEFAGSPLPHERALWHLSHRIAFAAARAPLSPDGRWFVGQRPPPTRVGPTTHRWVIWDLHGPRLLAEGAMADEFEWVFSADSSTLLLLDQRAQAEIWDMTTGQAHVHIDLRLTPADFDDARRAGMTLALERDGCLPLAYVRLSPNGLYLAAAYGNLFGMGRSTGHFRVYSTATGRVLWQRTYARSAPGDGLYPPEFSADGSTIIMANDPAAAAPGDPLLEAAPGDAFAIRFIDAESGEERARVPLEAGWGSDEVSRNQMSPDRRLYLVAQPWFQHSAETSMLDWLREWIPWVGPAPKRGNQLISVIDVEARREVFRLPNGPAVDAWLANDGRALITRTVSGRSRAGSDDPREFTCWDVPTRKPLRWVVGVPLALAGAVVAARFGWRYRRRQRPANCASEPPA